MLSAGCPNGIYDCWMLTVVFVQRKRYEIVPRRVGDISWLAYTFVSCVCVMTSIKDDRNSSSFLCGATLVH